MPTSPDPPVPVPKDLKFTIKQQQQQQLLQQIVNPFQHLHMNPPMMPVDTTIWMVSPLRQRPSISSEDSDLSQSDSDYQESVDGSFSDGADAIDDHQRVSTLSIRTKSMGDSQSTAPPAPSTSVFTRRQSRPKSEEVDIAAEIQQTLLKLNMKRRDTVHSNACDSDIFFPQPSPTYFCPSDAEQEDSDHDDDDDNNECKSVTSAVSFQSRLTTVDSIPDPTYYIFKFKCKDNTIAFQLPSHMFQHRLSSCEEEMETETVLVRQLYELMAVKLEWAPKLEDMPVFYYLDEDGDRCKIVTDDDLRVALHATCPQGEGKLTLIHESQ